MNLIFLAPPTFVAWNNSYIAIYWQSIDNPLTTHLQSIYNHSQSIYNHLQSIDNH